MNEESYNCLLSHNSERNQTLSSYAMCKITNQTMSQQIRCQLIFGWQITRDDLEVFLLENQAGTCGGTYVTINGSTNVTTTSGDPGYQCLCGTACWTNIHNVLPAGIAIVKTHPVLDMPGDSEGNDYFVDILRLDNDRTTLERVVAIPGPVLIGVKEVMQKITQQEEIPPPQFISSATITN